MFAKFEIALSTIKVKSYLVPSALGACRSLKFSKGLLRKSVINAHVGFRDNSITFFGIFKSFALPLPQNYTPYGTISTPEESFNMLMYIEIREQLAFLTMNLV